MDLKQIALAGYQSCADLVLKDLAALPETAFTQRFGGTCRTVCDMIYEMNLVSDHVGITIRGEPLFDWPEGGWITAPEGFDTKDVVIEAFKASSDKMRETVESFSQEQLEATVKTERGESSRFERVRFVTVHNFYHLGQINFIQTLLGDSEWHWN